MTRTRNRQAEPAPDQESLFDLGEVAPPSPSTPGVSVKIRERAIHLNHTLNLISAARQREGFSHATDYESPHRQAIEEHYGSSGVTDRIKKGAEENISRDELNAKWQFAYASGYISLKQSGLISPEEADEWAREDFRNLIEENYGSPQADKDRAKFKRHLKKTSKR